MIINDTFIRDFGRIFVWYPFRFMVLSLPMPTIFRIGRLMGILEFLGSERRRTIMIQNVQRVIGLKKTEAYDIVKKNFGFHYIHLLEYFKFPQFSKDNIDHFVEYQGLEHLDACLQRKRGAILVHLHLGTMQIPLVALGLKGYCMNQIGQREPENRRLSWVHRKVALRQRLRIEASVPATFINIGMTKYLRAAYRSLEKNEILMIPGDGRGGPNPIGNKYVQITFLGQKAYFPRGPIVLARKTGAMMLPLFCYHLEDGKQCIEIHHPLKLSFSKNADDDIQKNTQLYADFLSQGVIDHPEHWMFWEEFAPGQMIRDKA